MPKRLGYTHHRLRWALTAIVCVYLLAPVDGRADNCPAMKGASGSLDSADAGKRYAFIARVLRREKQLSRYWNVTWTALAAGGLAASLTLAKVVDNEDFVVSQQVSAVKAGLAVVGYSILPLNIPELDEAKLRGQPMCQRVAIAEQLLRKAARKERQKRLLDHASVVLASVASFLYLHLERDKLGAAIINTVSGAMFGELKAFTSPMGAVAALRAYRSGKLNAARAAPRWRLLAQPHLSGGGVVSLLRLF